MLSANDLGECVATPDAVKEAESVTDIALTAGVSTNDRGEWTDTQGFVGKILEVHELERGNHVTSSRPSAAWRGEVMPARAAM